MADTVRTLSALQALLPDNSARAISPQDERDFLVSALKRYNRTVTTTPTALTTNDRDVFADATAGAVTLTLPAASTCTNVEITVIKIDAGVNDVIIDADGAELINGGATLTLDAQWDCARLVCNGAAWYAFIGA